MKNIKAPEGIVQSFFSDYEPLGSQTAKIGDSANGVVIVSRAGDPNDKYSLKIGGIDKISAEEEKRALLGSIIGEDHVLPKGVVLEKEDKQSGITYGGLLTPYLPDLQPFSRQNLYLPKFGNTRLARMGKFAELLARAHSAGFGHGDYQGKNVGNRANGTAMVFDFEGSSEFDPTLEHMARAKVLEDMVAFKKSMAIKNLYGLFPDPLAIEIEDAFDTRYIEEVDRLGVISTDLAFDVSGLSTALLLEWAAQGGLDRAKSRFKDKVTVMAG